MLGAISDARCTVESEVEQDRLLAHTERMKICLDVSIPGLVREDPVAQTHKYQDGIACVHLKDVGLSRLCVTDEGTVGWTLDSSPKRSPGLATPAG